jgi:hypothetical protein
MKRVLMRSSKPIRKVVLVRKYRMGWGPFIVEAAGGLWKRGSGPENPQLRGPLVIQAVKQTAVISTPIGDLLRATVP